MKANRMNCWENLEATGNAHFTLPLWISGATFLDCNRMLNSIIHHADCMLFFIEEHPPLSLESFEVNPVHISLIRNNFDIHPQVTCQQACKPSDHFPAQLDAAILYLRK